jgi:tetratricopeptide (TPR) repeat protein
MPILSAENSFRKGLVALVEGDPATAATHFQSAILIERQHGVTRPQMRYLSYYGLSLAQGRGANSEAIQACETAIRRDFYNADLYLNLGRVYALAGKRSKAMHAFERGLILAPSHKVLRAEMGKFERRERPPLSIVSRTHPLNKVLGKLRAELRRRTPRWFSGFRAVTPSS